MRFRRGGNHQGNNCTNNSLPLLRLLEEEVCKNGQRQRWRKIGHRNIFVLVLLMLIILLLCRKNFVVLRKSYVQLHYWIAPRSAFLLSNSEATLLDLSEGEIYKNLPRTVAFPTPGIHKGGCVWDVGANNGVWHSNSHFLIHAMDFYAWLFEPDAAPFLQLRKNYAGHPRVKLHNFALAEKTGIQTLRLFPMGFENTIEGQLKCVFV